MREARRCVQSSLAEYNKGRPAPQEEDYAKSKNLSMKGEVLEPFNYRGMRCLVEICNDNSDSDRHAKSVDLHLMPTFGGGMLTSKAHSNGWNVDSDSAGVTRIRQGPGNLLGVHSCIKEVSNVKPPASRVNRASSRTRW